MEWQPIETAPMDGTDILLFCPGETPPHKIGYWVESKWPIYYTGFTSGKETDAEGSWETYNELSPTHWIDLNCLPEPPKTNE